MGYKLVSDNLLRCLKDIVGAIKCSIGKPGGIATLDSTGNVPADQLANAGGGGGAGVSSFNTRTGPVTLSSTDVKNALTFTPEHVFNVKDYGAKGDGTTDDTTSIQAAINAAVNAKGGTIFFPMGAYIIGGAIQNDVGGANPNSQLYIPVIAFSGSDLSDLCIIQFKGEGTTSPGNFVTSVFTEGVLPNNGTVLYSTYTGTVSTTTAWPAVIGSDGSSIEEFGSFNLASVAFNDLTVVVKDNPNGAGPEIGGINGAKLIGVTFNNIAVYTDGPGETRVVATRQVAGIETTNNSGGSSYNVWNCGVNGFPIGYTFGEHVDGEQIQATQCAVGYAIKDGSHSSRYGRICAQWCGTALGIHPSAIGSGFQITMQEFDLEWGAGNTGTVLYNTTYGIDDPSGKLTGEVTYSGVVQGGASLVPTWTVNGAQNLVIKYIDNNQILRTSANANFLAPYFPFSNNGPAGLTITNTNNGTSAIALFQLFNDNSGVMEMGLVGSGFTPSGLLTEGGTGYIYCTSKMLIEANGPIEFTSDNGASAVVTLATSNQVGIRQPTPTANLHIGAGAASANSAPLKIDSGTLMATPESGALEFDGTNLYFTIGGVRKTVTLI